MSEEEVREIVERTTAALLTELRGIQVDRLYEPDEVAQILRLQRVNTVHDIPEELLPPTRVGPKGGKKLYRGRDILRYMDQCRAIPLDEDDD